MNKKWFVKNIKSDDYARDVLAFLNELTQHGVGPEEIKIIHTDRTDSSMGELYDRANIFYFSTERVK